MLNWKKIFGIGVLLWIVGTIYTWLTCGWLFQWVYTIEPIIWQPAEAMMSGANLFWSNLAGIVIGILFVLVYAILYKGIPEKGAKKGMMFGVLLWLACTFGGMVTMPFYMTISWTVIIYWLI